MNLNELKDRAYATACSKGFHDKELSNKHWLMLVITELSEAIEADRKNCHAQKKMFLTNAYTAQADKSRHWAHCFDLFIKDTVEDEMADACIRLLDFAGLHRIDLNHLDVMVNRRKKTEVVETFSETIYTIVSRLCEPQVPKDKMTILGNIILYAKHNLGIDIEWHIEQKMKYNALRPAMHGKKY